MVYRSVVVILYRHMDDDIPSLIPPASTVIHLFFLFHLYTISLLPFYIVIFDDIPSLAFLFISSTCGEGTFTGLERMTCAMESA